MNDYYNKQLEESQKYQDFVCTQMFYKLGWPIVLYSSKENQLNTGESISGVEIKYDKKLKDTGNLYIETKERTSAKKEFIPSGIYREDNSWIYIVGDYNDIYIFSKKHLRKLFEQGKHTEICGKNDKREETSKGFLITSKYAEILSINFLKLNK